MRSILIAASTLLIAGCASDPALNYYRGNYYMVGDPDCVQMREVSSGRVMCMDKNGNETGLRRALSEYDLQQYQANRVNQQVQMQQLSQQLQQMSQSFANSSQQMLQQSQQYTAPQVQPMRSYGGSGITTYRQVGNSVIGSDGTRCEMIGPNVICR